MRKELLESIHLNEKLSDSVKSDLESYVKNLERQITLDAFKIKKLEGTIKTMSFILNQNIKDLENKSEEIKSQNEIINQQKHEVENKQREIIDSITYALRIQKTILPPSNISEENSLDSFIVYMPKDIVAGDFYWIEKFEDVLLFAVCDCTGHGVPGALVSIVCYNALNRAVREFKQTQPSIILDIASKIIEENFNKHAEGIADGMDISLCAFNQKTNTLQWAGANNPLWLISNNELNEIKPNKQPVGRFENKTEFNNHSINFKKGDLIYMFTDGYSDQFGYKNNKKYKQKNLKSFLLSIQNKTMNEQRELLINEFANWKGEIEQTDDMCILGIKL